MRELFFLLFCEKNDILYMKRDFLFIFFFFPSRPLVYSSGHFFIKFLPKYILRLKLKFLMKGENFMETLLSIWNYLLIHLLQPIWNSLVALWDSVLVPFGNAMVDWVKNFMPWCESFADFCTALFKLRYQGRIYSFMILLPLAVLVLLLTNLTKRRIRRVRRTRK